MRTAIVSGTFDPITVGHLNVIARAAKLFNRVVVAVSCNSEKKNMFPDEVRLNAVKAAIKGIVNAEAELCDGLLADFCNKYEAPVIVRGARSGSEFDYERSLFVINKGLNAPETVILPAESGMDHISSTYVRELLKYGRSIEGVVPAGAKEIIEEYFKL